MNAALATGNFTDSGEANAVGGVYTLNGASCLITDIVDTSHPDNQFNPATDIDAGGIKAPGGGTDSRQIAIKQPLLGTLLASGFTVLLEIFSNDTEIQFFSWMYDTPDFNTLASGTTIYSESTPSSNYGEARVANSNRTRNASAKPVKNQINRMAVTLASDRAAFSINGGSVIKRAGTCLDAGMNTVLLGFSGITPNTTRLRAFTFYQVVADGDLPTLSALP